MRLSLGLLVLPVWAYCLGWALAENWSQFRGSTGDGAATQSKPPVEWASDKNVAWKTRIPGFGWSQPVVWGERIFVTTAVTDKQPRPNPNDWSPGDGLGGLSAFLGSVRKPPAVEYRWMVVCLDRATGKVIWEQVARTGRPTIPIHARNSYATETPVTDGERVIAYFGMTGLYCYDVSGNLLWSKDLGTFPLQMDWGTGSSPVVHDGRVYVQCDNDKASFLVAHDARTGDELWRVPREERSNWSTPYVWKNKQRTELVCAGGTKMRSYDPATGKVLWEMAGSGRCSSSPVGSAELLYVNSGDRLTGQRGILAAIRPGGTGDISLAPKSTTSEFVAWSVALTGGRVASPLLVRDCLYLPEQQGGLLRCLDAQTGMQHFRERLPGAVGFTASPWSADDKVFCLDQNGTTFVLAAGPKLEVLATNKLDDELFWSSPAVAGDAHLIRGIDHLYCIEER
jgi:outer membrane protein assembly factor BamB